MTHVPSGRGGGGSCALGEGVHVPSGRGGGHVPSGRGGGVMCPWGGGSCALGELHFELLL